jgi:hypothetical protein
VWGKRNEEGEGVGRAKTGEVGEGKVCWWGMGVIFFWVMAGTLLVFHMT